MGFLDAVIFCKLFFSGWKISICYCVANCKKGPPYLHTYSKGQASIPPSCGKNFVESEWWHISKCLSLNQSFHQLAPWLKSPAICFSSPQLSLCLEMAVVPGLFRDYKRLFGPFLLPKFSLAYQNFHITCRNFFTIKFLVSLQTKLKEGSFHSLQQLL